MSKSKRDKNNLDYQKNTSGHATHEVRNALQPGTRISGYEIKEVIGEGGFGKVYLSLDDKLNKEVAIKEYFPDQYAKRDEDNVVPLSGGDKEFNTGKKQFIREARALADYRHLNIVEVYETFSANNTEYMVRAYKRNFASNF